MLRDVEVLHSPNAKMGGSSADVPEKLRPGGCGRAGQEWKILMPASANVLISQAAASGFQHTSVNLRCLTMFVADVAAINRASAAVTGQGRKVEPWPGQDCGANQVARERHRQAPLVLSFPFLLALSFGISQFQRLCWRLDNIPQREPKALPWFFWAQASIAFRFPVRPRATEVRWLVRTTRQTRAITDTKGGGVQRPCHRGLQSYQTQCFLQIAHCSQPRKQEFQSDTAKVLDSQPPPVVLGH